MSKVIQEQKSTLWCIKFCNLMKECPNLKNDVFFKALFRALFEFYRDELTGPIKEGNRVYKQMDEINEQLDENQREIKNYLGEILKEFNLFFKKFDEDEEGENEKKLKNEIIPIFKLTHDIFNKIL